MAVAALSRMTQDYLQAIWKLAEWSPGPVSMNDLAAKLEVTVSTVSSGIKRLRAHGLVTHERYGAVELTEAGRTAALQMVRRHRLIETYLVERLGYGWDEVHDEAEHLEHAVSDRFIERISAELGHPVRDPHGDAIPGPDGSLPHSAARRLVGLAAGDCGLVARISDESAELLRYLAARGIGLDIHLDLVARRDAAGVIAVRRGAPDSEQEPMELGLAAAEAIWVVADRHSTAG